MCEKCKHFLDGKCRKGIPHLLGEVISCGTFEVMTNGDAIRAMTDEALAGVIKCPFPFGIDSEICFLQKSCAACMLEWLRTPVEE